MARKQLRSSRELKSCSPLRGIAETSFTPKWDASGRKPKHCRLWKLSRILNEQLQNPIVQNDSRLRLRCLIAKGYTDIEIDYRAAKRDWLEAQDIAKSLGESQWVTGASGELCLIVVAAQLLLQHVSQLLQSSRRNCCIQGAPQHSKLLMNSFGLKDSKLLENHPLSSRGRVSSAEARTRAARAGCVRRWVHFDMDKRGAPGVWEMCTKVCAICVLFSPHCLRNMR
jgi:hypothetical protein